MLKSSVKIQNILKQNSSFRKKTDPRVKKDEKEISLNLASIEENKQGYDNQAKSVTIKKKLSTLDTANSSRKNLPTISDEDPIDQLTRQLKEEQ